MPDLLSDLFCGLLHLLGISVEGDSEREQSLALFALCGLFGVIAGCLSSGLTSTVWFVVGGIGVVAFMLVAYWTEK